MSSHAQTWTIGVEEEYQVIDPTTRGLATNVERILSHVPPDATLDVSTELQRCQIEIATPICHSISDVRTTLRQARQTLISAATEAHCWIAAAGTHPFSPWNEQRLTSNTRYQTMHYRYQQLVREQVIFGCHVHIGCSDRENALQIMNRARIWLAPLLALTANSPFWLGEDTGYASFRTEIWSRWPMAGPPAHFASGEDYAALIDALVTTECIEDISHIYWDMRLSERFPTLEFRVMDVCMTIDEAVMVTGITRALAQTCHEQAQRNTPFPRVPNELLRAAQWRAARYGLDAALIDLTHERVVPARELIERLLDFIRPALLARGEWDEIASLVHATLHHGNGATRQRRLYQQTGRIQDVVDFVVQETAQGRLIA